MVEAFPPERYVGVDINPHAIAFCRDKQPARRFELAGEVLPVADTALAYAVLLHVPDGSVAGVIGRLMAAAPRALVVEILGRNWRSERKLPLCYNRTQEDYVDLFARSGASLARASSKPYNRYGGVRISFLDFRRKA